MNLDLRSRSDLTWKGHVADQSICLNKKTHYRWFEHWLATSTLLKGNCSPLEKMYFLISFIWDFGLNVSEYKIITNYKMIYFSV